MEESRTAIRFPAIVVLLSADRLPVLEIARRIGVSRPMVWRWQQRYAEEGLEGACCATRRARHGPRLQLGDMPATPTGSAQRYMLASSHSWLPSCEASASLPSSVPRTMASHTFPRIVCG